MICPEDNQPCTGTNDDSCYRRCLEGVMDNNAWNERNSIIDKPKGVWFVYGLDYNAYPIGVFDDELEARRTMEPWEKLIFWPFGEKWYKVEP